MFLPSVCTEEEMSSLMVKLGFIGEELVDHFADGSSAVWKVNSYGG
jgi:hypothetical protein